MKWKKKIKQKESPLILLAENLDKFCQIVLKKVEIKCMKDLIELKDILEKKQKLENLNLD